MFSAQQADTHKTTVTLYHQTSRSSAEKILKTGTMQRGQDGYAGPGIYFAATPHTTHYKARQLGAILKCEVYLGRIKRINAPGNWSGRFWRFFGRYDSVEITSRRGVEFVVYHPSQVKSIKGHSITTGPGIFILLLILAIGFVLVYLCLSAFSSLFVW